MSGITFSLGRNAPAAFSPRVKKTLYQGYRGHSGGAQSSFRGLHDVSTSVLSPNQDGVLLVQPDLDWPDDKSPLVTPEQLGLPSNLKLMSVVRIAALGLGGAKLGGVVGIALLALAIPDALILYRDFVGTSAPTPTKGPSIPLSITPAPRPYYDPRGV